MLIVGRNCVFSHNYDDVVFTWIFCVIYITCFKIGHGFFHIFIAVSDKHLVTPVMQRSQTGWLLYGCQGLSRSGKLMSSLDLCNSFLMISSIFSVICCRTCATIASQQYFLNSFALGCCLAKTHLHIPSSVR